MMCSLPTGLETGSLGCYHTIQWVANLESLQDALQRDFCLVMVAEAAHGIVAGYMMAWLLADEVQLLSLAIHPQHRRRGLGRQLLSELLTTR